MQCTVSKLYVQETKKRFCREIQDIQTTVEGRVVKPVEFVAKIHSSDEFVNMDGYSQVD